MVDNTAWTKLVPINDTFSSIEVTAATNPSQWNTPIDLLRFKCETNYDVPFDTKFVWMYVTNPNTNVLEIWHRTDVNGFDDAFQTFMFDNYNSVSNRNESLSEFVKQLVLQRVPMIQFQCASYYETNQLLAKSKNLSLLKGI